MKERYLVGYARVSTDDQELRMQIDALRRYGVPEGRIFSEKASGKSLDNRLPRHIIRALRVGDRVVVWKLDRLGRSVKDLVHAVEQIEAAGADLVSITEGVDTSTAMGRFFFHIIASIAELERGMISERTKAGMAARKAEDPNVKWGAKHFVKEYPARMNHVQELYEAGIFSLERRPSKKHPEAVVSKGLTANEIRLEINAVREKGAPDVKSPETVRRWLRQGAPGLDR